MHKKITQKKLIDFIKNIKQKSNLSDRDKNIIKLYESGLSCEKIGEKLNLNRITVNKILHRNNIKMRKIKEYHIKRHEKIIALFLDGKTIEEISEITNLKQETIKNLLLKKKLILSNNEKKIVQVARYIELKNKGYSNELIAQILNLTLNQVRRLPHNSGIKISIIPKKKIPNNLAELILDALKGKNIYELSKKYNLTSQDIKKLLEIFGLHKKERLIEITFNRNEAKK